MALMYRLSQEAYEHVCRTLEAMQSFTKQRMAVTRFDRDLLRIDLMIADTLEILDREESAA